MPMACTALGKSVQSRANRGAAGPLPGESELNDANLFFQRMGIAHGEQRPAAFAPVIDCNHAVRQRHHVAVSGKKAIRLVYAALHLDPDAGFQKPLERLVSRVKSIAIRDSRLHGRRCCTFPTGD